jgi:hypothetical protein
MHTFLIRSIAGNIVTRVRPQPVFPISDILSVYRKPTGGTLKLLKCLRTPNAGYRSISWPYTVSVA